MHDRPSGINDAEIRRKRRRYCSQVRAQRTSGATVQSGMEKGGQQDLPVYQRSETPVQILRDNWCNAQRKLDSFLTKTKHISRYMERCFHRFMGP